MARQRDDYASNRLRSEATSKVMRTLRRRIKWALFPGINLHARQRFRELPRHFGRSADGAVRRVLDAGCGNGMLAYQSYLLGNRVQGVSIKPGEIERNRELFNGLLGVPEERLSFAVHSLYNIDSLGLEFDEIICSEVLEHLVRDEEVCRSFWRILRPGGVLHLCCPNAEHPDHAAHPLDPEEHGGHVRSGYTEASYRKLLEPIGFKVSAPVGLGGPIRQAFNKRIIAVQEKWGLLPGLLLFSVAWPLAALDVRRKVPYSIYVQATRES